ncbi:CD59 antigen domain-containing protein [Aphelenchoides bicaudatus]|nr:CD59 antigen domain-containing protein [Aphelenchoides bicaudatus]
MTDSSVCKKVVYFAVGALKPKLFINFIANGQIAPGNSSLGINFGTLSDLVASGCWHLTNRSKLMVQCQINQCGFLFSIIFLLLNNSVESIRCFYCASPGTKIAPQLWLHTEPCAKRRYTTCASPDQACVVVKLTHSRLNFTVSGCSEDRFEGCDQFIQMAPHGPTAIAPKQILRIGNGRQLERIS